MAEESAVNYWEVRLFFYACSPSSVFYIDNIILNRSMAV